MIRLNAYITKAHNNACEKGFWDGDNHNIGEKLMLIVTELAEAMEALRGRGDEKDIEGYKQVLSENKIDFDRDLFQKMVKDSFEDEVTDSVIRIFDLCGRIGIDLEFHVDQKMRYNSTRERLHGKKL